MLMLSVMIVESSIPVLKFASGSFGERSKLSHMIRSVKRQR